MCRFAPPALVQPHWPSCICFLPWGICSFPLTLFLVPILQNNELHCILRVYHMHPPPQVFALTVNSPWDALPQTMQEAHVGGFYRVEVLEGLIHSLHSWSSFGNALDPEGFACLRMPFIP